MTSDLESPRYEIRAGRLFVNGERQTVAGETVIAAAALHRVESKDPVDPACGGIVEISEELGRLILRMEARKAVRGLSEALSPFLAT
jgi:hypothetical protein